MPFFRQRKSSWVGLGLHQEHISLIKIARVNSCYSIEHFQLTQLPSACIREGKIHQPAEVEHIIASMVAEANAKECPAIVSFPLTQVINKRIRLASFLEDEERYNEIASDMATHFPDVNEALNFDYATVGSEEGDDDLLLVAARVKQVDAFLAVVESAGLNVRVMDVDVYAYVRAINFIYGVSEQKICLLDAALSQLIILHQGAILFSHPVAFDSVESIVQTVRKIFQLFSPPDSMMNSTMDVKKVLLSGKFDSLRTLKQELTELLPVNVEWINPFVSPELITKKEKSGLQKDMNEALVTLGLGLRSYPEW